MSREINEAGLRILRMFEGLDDGDPSTVNLDPYLDPVEIWTIGYGHAISQNGRFLRGSANKDKAFALYPGGITVAQAEQLLHADALDKARDVSALIVPIVVTENQFSALVSLVYNIGAKAFGASTLLKKLKAGDLVGAAGQFGRWTKAAGRELPGLVARRASERLLFES